MSDFIPTSGFTNCPKCFGWQVRDFTPRNASGWPIASPDIRDCDHCHGKGELSLTAPEPSKARGRKAWQPPAEINDVDWQKPLEPSAVKIEPDMTPAELDNSVSNGWTIFDKAKPVSGWADYGKGS